MYGEDMEQVWSKYEGNIERNKQVFWGQRDRFTDEFSELVTTRFNR